MIRRCVTAAALLPGLCLAAAGLKLIPYPQSVKQGAGMLALPVSVRIHAASAEDVAAREVLAEELKRVYGLGLGSSAPGITIGRAGDKAIDAEIARRKLDVSALGRPESYLLSVDSTGVLIASRSAAGAFYGAQTLRQLLTPARSGAAVPHLTIADWPALAHRGLSLDVSRGPIVTEEQMKAVIRTLAAYKMNMLSFYMEHVFEYSHSPGVTREGGAITPDLMKRVIAYGKRYHVELLPQQQTFGHLHHVLKFERYAPLAEIPFGHVISPAEERGYDWIHNAIAELASVFPSPYVHIGSDETRDLGQGRTREYAGRAGVGNVYMEHMQKVFDRARPLGKKLMFWGDIALSHPDLIPRLPRELVAMTWTYNPEPDFTRYIEPFRKLGMEVFVCPGVNNWNRIFPNLTWATGNINNFLRDGKKLGAVGMLNTHWGDDGESLFNMTWHGVVFGAAASWQPGTVDVDAFNRAWDWAFYRRDGEAIVQAMYKLDRIHELLRSVKERDAFDELMWFDPFSRTGAERVRAMHPLASEVRLLAEDALIALNRAQAGARLHRETIDYLRFAARRLDALGFRIQAAKAIGDIYRNSASGQPGVGRISGANGLIQDLRENAVELREMWTKLWLAENRPYWLGNVTARYDEEIAYWTRRGLQFGEISRQSRAGIAAPALETLGLTLP